jgi:ABC-2 type transport system ATP-binding protein
MLKLENINIKYENFTMKIGSIEFNRGDVIGIIGENGSGKTTLVKSILNRIKYEGKITRDIDPKNIGVVMQNNEFSDLLKVSEIIKIILNVRKFNEEQKAQIVSANLNEILTNKYGELSGGQKQRLFLFLSTYHLKELYIFDEITTGLDFQSRKEVLHKLKDNIITDNSLTIIISHYFAEIEDMVNKLLIMKSGEIVAFGSIPKLLNEYNIKFCFQDEQKGTYIFINNNEERKKIYDQMACGKHNIKEINSQIEMLYAYFYEERGELESAII